MEANWLDVVEVLVAEHPVLTMAAAVGYWNVMALYITSGCGNLEMDVQASEKGGQISLSDSLYSGQFVTLTAM